jgi:hypothetical protein
MARSITGAKSPRPFGKRQLDRISGSISSPMRAGEASVFRKSPLVAALGPLVPHLLADLAPVHKNSSAAGRAVTQPPGVIRLEESHL